MSDDKLRERETGAIRAERGPGRLRVVVFTTGGLGPVTRVLFERLAADPLLDLAIIVDDYKKPRRPFLDRAVRGLRREGLAWLWFRVTSTLVARARQIALSLLTLRKPGAGAEDSFDALQRRTGVPVYRVPDIHAEPSLALLRSLRPQLGVIVGGRVLRDSVIMIPERGTLNLHKRKVPEYRGGGPVGYWEVLAGESSIGVTIHYAISQVDAGPVVAAENIPIEECDTLESLKIKADLVGARLYHDTIRRLALGVCPAEPQDLSRGRTYRAPSELSVSRLQRRLRRKAATVMPGLRARPSWIVRLRVVLQYALLAPLLSHLRGQLIRRRRAPVAIFFYHVVANRPANRMCLPLEEFVEQVEFLRRYYAVVGLDEAVARLRSGQNEDIVAVITFDDGYRDNAWAIEYLRYFGIPAAFFVSIGHVRDGSAFEHDRRGGFETAFPFSEADVRRLASDGFVIGSHGMYHEDFGPLDGDIAAEVQRESRRLIGRVSGNDPEYFSFPTGLAGTNITAQSLGLATRHYRYVFSAYGGYNFPSIGRQHFLRMGNPDTLIELALTMNGYTGFRPCVGGNAWGLKTDARSVSSAESSAQPVARGGHRDQAKRSAIALIAPSMEILGGNAVQARALTHGLRTEGHEVHFIPINPTFPRGLRWVRRYRHVRTVINETCYLPTLLGLRQADVVHIFSASHASFVLASLPAILAARSWGKRLILHYHSGLAPEHLARWGALVHPWLRLVDEIVVPSEYLRGVFARHGYRTRVIPNIVDTSRFGYRERRLLRPRLLSTRNLELYYRVDVTLEAFARVQARYPGAILTIVGCGSEEGRLRRLAASLVGDGVRFMGRVEPEAMPGLYDDADIFLNSSVVDNQPVSVLEAFAAGLPVVSTATGDLAALVRDDETGAVVPPEDPAAMAEAIVALLGDPDRAAAMARRAREETERYTWPHVRHEWAAVYSGAESPRGAPGRAAHVVSEKMPVAKG